MRLFKLDLKVLYITLDRVPFDTNYHGPNRETVTKGHLWHFWNLPHVVETPWRLFHRALGVRLWLYKPDGSAMQWELWINV